MGMLTDIITERDAQRTAAQVLNAAAQVRQQDTDNDAALLAIQASYPDGIPAVLANKAVLIDVGRKLETKTSITAKRASFKTNLQALKGQVNNTDYETEIQTEIDLL